MVDLSSVSQSTTERKRVQQMSTNMQHQIEWRRAKVMELLSKGENNQSEIAL
jgi:hypothetical protein